MERLRFLCVVSRSVVDMPNRMELDNNLQYEYQKYMVARGYSELWINNHYVKEKEEFFLIVIFRVLCIIIKYIRIKR